jgi:hypothetical protein
VKEYIVGTPKQIFNYMTRASLQGNLDEVILAGRQAGICFDLEVKRQKHANLEEILRGHMAVLGQEQPGDGVVNALALAYRAVAVCDFTEEECWAGMRVPHYHIIRILSQVCSQEFDDKIGPGGELQCVTGCRKSKRVGCETMLNLM